MAVLRAVGVPKTTVWRWQEYFSEAGVEGLVKGRCKPPGREPPSVATGLPIDANDSIVLVDVANSPLTSANMKFA